MHLYIVNEKQNFRLGHTLNEPHIMFVACLRSVIFSINSTYSKGIIAGNVVYGKYFAFHCVISAILNEKADCKYLLYNRMMNCWSLCISVWYGCTILAVL